jgi:hypothetical protein
MSVVILRLSPSGSDRSPTEQVYRKQNRVCFSAVYTSTPPCAFMTWCVIKAKNNFAFTLPVCQNKEVIKYMPQLRCVGVNFVVMQCVLVWRQRWNCLVVYFTAFLVSQAVLASNDVVIDEWWIDKGLEGSCRCLLRYSLSLWLYSPLDFGCFFTFLILYTVGLLGREISPS